MRRLQLGIRSRIYGGFGLLIVLALGLSGFGIQRLSLINGEIGKLGIVTDNAKRVQEISSSLEVIARATLHYNVDENANSRAALLKNMAAIGDRLREAEAEAEASTSSDERRRIYTGVEANLASYRTLTDTLIATHERLGVARTKLLSSGDGLTAAADRVVQSANGLDDTVIAEAAANVERTVLLVRLAHWRFLATQDRYDIATFKTNRGKANAAISILEQLAGDGVRNTLPPLKAALADYAVAFDEVSDQTLAANDLYADQMVPLLTTMRTAITQAMQSQSDSCNRTRTDSDDTITSAQRLSAILSGLTLVLGAVLAVVIGGGIAGPLLRMTEIMTRLAGGNTDLRIAGGDRSDELGSMARALEVFKANMIETGRLAAEQAADQERKAQRQRTIEQHIANFDRSVAGLLDVLNSASAEMRSAAESMSGTAGQTDRQASVVSVAAEQASANVQTMAAATEEMASSASEIARQVTRSTVIAGRAVEAARSTDRQVQGLADSAQKIEAVVAIINNIASQTNLLALNATIEAARAGDAGKGFAVVASEVKALAGETGRATEEIGAQIQAIQHATRVAVEAIKGIGATIDEMNEISTAIATAMEEQGATTGEMTRSTQQAARGTQEVSTTIGDVSAGARATGAAASQVLSAAGQLSEKAGSLRTEVDGFLDKIRAA